MKNYKSCVLVGFAVVLFPFLQSFANICPVTVTSGEGVSVQIQDGDKLIFSSLCGTGSFKVVQPFATTSVIYKNSDQKNEAFSFNNGEAKGLKFSESYRNVTPDLIERTVTVTAKSDQRYYLYFGWKTAQQGDYYSFLGEEKTSAKYTLSCSGPEFGNNESLQTFPFLGIRIGDKLYGMICDTPGMWENRSFMNFDRENNNLSLCNGDGSAKRTILFPHEIDATSTYRAQYDGWQHIEQGETQTWKTWIFSSNVKSLYDVQLAAHLALANAKGFNQSGIEAILRNTSCLLLRRNFLRSESDYIFISGVGYGWKQWVTDAFYMSHGLDDVKFDREALAAIFFDRLNYEDNAQYYLIWSLLVKRAGGSPDMRTVGRAYRFIRDHEVDGLYIPPRLQPDKKCYKTYHDQLNYDDDDAPSSDQGFHCGALMAAQELGFPGNHMGITFIHGIQGTGGCVGRYEND